MEPTFIALGLVVGTLVGMTGVGAGSIVTPALVLSGVPAAVAVGTDLAYAAASKAAGTLAHRVQGSVDLRLAALLALGSLPAAALTIALLAASGAGKYAFINPLLAAALVLTALALFLGQGRIAAIAARYETRISRYRSALTVSAGAVLGVLVSASSVGAGALAAMLLVVLYPSMPTVRIAGTDIAHAVPLTLLAALGHLWLGNVNFPLAANLLAGSLPGIVVGSLAAGRLPEAFVRRLLAVVLFYAGGRLMAASL